jgi:Ca2+-binding EF-hand superfamily protein
MRAVVSKMLGDLKVKINTTEKVLGDRLKVLDRDNDGQISYDELRGVVAKVMRKGAATEEHVAQLFDALDSNKDGKGRHAFCSQYSC